MSALASTACWAALHCWPEGCCRAIWILWLFSLWPGLHARLCECRSWAFTDLLEEWGRCCFLPVSHLQSNSGTEIPGWDKRPPWVSDFILSIWSWGRTWTACKQCMLYGSGQPRGGDYCRNSVLEGQDWLPESLYFISPTIRRERLTSSTNSFAGFACCFHSVDYCIPLYTNCDTSLLTSSQEQGI